MLKYKFTCEPKYGCSYTKFTSNNVAMTVEYDDDTYIDVDADKNIIGIEFLENMAPSAMFEKISLILKEYKQKEKLKLFKKKDFTELFWKTFVESVKEGLTE